MKNLNLGIFSKIVSVKSGLAGACPTLHHVSVHPSERSPWRQTLCQTFPISPPTCPVPVSAVMLPRAAPDTSHRTFGDQLTVEGVYKRHPMGSTRSVASASKARAARRKHSAKKRRAGQVDGDSDVEGVDDEDEFDGEMEFEDME